MLFHNLKVALRNLMKYKVQTVISVLSIAIGIVTFSLTYSLMTKFRLPSLYSQPYHDRTYDIEFKTIDNGEREPVTMEIVRAIKGDGGLNCAEQVGVANGAETAMFAEFHLPDSTVSKGAIGAYYIDPDYVSLIGVRSAITGEKVKAPKVGEAIVGEKFVEKYLHNADPIGAVQMRTNQKQPIPVTIVDVYEEPSQFDVFNECSFCFCVTEKFEDNNPENFYSNRIWAVLKEGLAKEDLLKEVNARVRPLGLEASLSKTIDGLNVKEIIAINLIVYIIGSLILFGAIVGFLRMQIQLFWMRRRELSLRTVNGASRMQLFMLLGIEIAISLSLAIIVAVMLGLQLQDFLDKNMDLVMRDSQIIIRRLWLYSIAVGGILLGCCGFIAWFTLCRIRKASVGLAANMRNSKNHFFRNVMLGVQIIICMVFVCSTFILVNGGRKILDGCNIPDNDSFYRNCLFLRLSYAEDPERLINEIGRIPELEEMVMCGKSFVRVDEVGNNPEAVEAFNGQMYFQTYFTSDTTIVSFQGMDVEWFRHDTDISQCVLICENLYNKFYELGLIDNNTLTLHIYGDSAVIFPIAGVIKNIPYDVKGQSLVAISPEFKKGESEYALVPKPGKEKALARNVDETINRIEPGIINKMVFNFREMNNPMLGVVEVVRTGGWILGMVSLAICAMGIFSTIALDTRARRKEVAIRKVNGAKKRDIYMMFSKVYGILIIISLFIAVPLSVGFNKYIGLIVSSVSPGTSISPVVPILLGVTIVIGLILLIVALHIRRVTHVNPSEIIAKD